ncbi:hypothetical protein LIHA111178_06660 [Litorimonas haliclonae]
MYGTHGLGPYPRPKTRPDLFRDDAKLSMRNSELLGGNAPMLARV